MRPTLAPTLPPAGFAAWTGGALLLAASLGACGDPEGPLDAAVDGGPDAGLDAGGSGRDPCPGDAGPLDAGVADGLSNVCYEAMLLSGFGLRFDDVSRRLGRFAVFPGVGAEPDGCPVGADARTAPLIAALGGEGVGGGELSATYHSIGAGAPAPSGGDAGAGWTGLRVGRGTTSFDLVGGEEGSRPALFDLAAAQMAGAPATVVVLQGFELDTDVTQATEFPDAVDPSDGYATRGISAALEGVSRDGDDLSWTVRARFALGRVGDEEIDGVLAIARLRVIVHWAVVALPVEPAAGVVSYRETHFGHGARELAVCRPEPSATALTIEGAGLEHAAAALTSFSLTLLPDAAPEGARVRELSVRIGDFAWSRAAATATMSVEGYATNEGAPRLPMDYAFEANVALLEWDGEARSRSLRFDARLEEGRNAFDLPLME